MPHSPFRHNFMMFDTAIDSHSTLPLTLNEAVEYWSHDHDSHESMGYMLRSRASERSLSFPPAPPSTRKNSLEIFGHTSHDKLRGESFSSDDSVPSMFEDRSGLSDSDADACACHDSYEESMGRLWDTYDNPLLPNELSEAVMFHGVILPGRSEDFQSPLLPCSSKIILPNEASSVPPRDKLRLPREKLGFERSLLPVSTRSQHLEMVVHRNDTKKKQEHFIVTQDSPPQTQTSGLRRSHAQRVPRHVPSTSKPLPATPEKREGCSLYSSQSKRSKSQPALSLFPHGNHSVHRDTPFHAHPATNPCNSSHAYSIHKTPPLPLLERSVFDYDTDDESRHDTVRQRSASIASKIHIRGLSLGSKFGMNPGKTGIKYEEPGRRRSATEIVMGVFGLGRK